ncbi:DUF5805 domain-containing protein [Natranaeroarchaeum aerophilus]|uniref:DUF5805 domain-containing protein n=1 Tax=Natranaeroarchaeum aerophilus TaxID=2917711 RepID=A0AAE3FQR7_9EURY|nr:DUF5805 domain-containing protein [Natranaeroarchaeum aerophilus]MCL9813922.1 DUF5805 domain-containing protein [Natranaeroarchaeum aerophilus]
MSTEDAVDTSRASVKTYVPAYQKTQWKEHADDLGMSQSEFVRTMVQAGRRGFGASPEEIENAPKGDSGTTDRTDTTAQQATNGAELGERVIALLQREGTLSWEDLVEALTDDIEERLDDTMAELQDESKVRYSGRHGGYTLSEDR